MGHSTLPPAPSGRAPRPSHPTLARSICVLNPAQRQLCPGGSMPLNKCSQADTLPPPSPGLRPLALSIPPPAPSVCTVPALTITLSPRMLCLSLAAHLAKLAPRMEKFPLMSGRTCPLVPASRVSRGKAADAPPPRRPSANPTRAAWAPRRSARTTCTSSISGS